MRVRVRENIISVLIRFGQKAVRVRVKSRVRLCVRAKVSMEVVALLLPKICPDEPMNIPCLSAVEVTHRPLRV